MMTAKEAYQKLMSDPDQFLRKYPVKVRGRTGASAVGRFIIQHASASTRPSKILGKLKMHESDFWTIRPNDSPALDENGVVIPGHEFDAHCVTVNVGANAAINYNLLQGGPDIVVTTELTGCSFIVRERQNALNVVHIQPPQGVSGENLQAQLSTTAGNTAVYGRGDYNNGLRAATIIGVRRGEWRIYAQKNNSNPYGDHHIKSLHMIWPTRQKV